MEQMRRIFAMWCKFPWKNLQDGFQICEELRTDPETQRIPVIVLTAKVLLRDRVRLEAMDVADMVRKPFKPIIIAVCKLLQYRKVGPYPYFPVLKQLAQGNVWKQVTEILGWSVH